MFSHLSPLGDAGTDWLVPPAPIAAAAAAAAVAPTAVGCPGEETVEARGSCWCACAAAAAAAAAMRESTLAVARSLALPLEPLEEGAAVAATPVGGGCADPSSLLSDDARCSEEVGVAASGAW